MGREAKRLTVEDPDYLKQVRLEMSFVDQMRRLYTLAKRIAKITKHKQKVDPDYTPNILVCDHCDSVCDVDAIDFDLSLKPHSGSHAFRVGTLERDTTSRDPEGRAG